MLLPDVNILIYAHRVDSMYHAFYLEWLEEAISTSLFALTPMTAAGFLRVVTHPRYPGGQTPYNDAANTLESIIAHPNFRWVFPGLGHWTIFSRLCSKCNCSGNLISDAQHAAIAIEHHCKWVTRDTDFGIFRRHGLDLLILDPDGAA